MSSCDTLEELGKELQKLIAVKADTMKLIVQFHKTSKLLSPFSDEHSRFTLQETSIIEGKSIRMMGMPKEEIDQVLQSVKTNMRIAGFDEEEKRMRHRMSNGSRNSLKLPQGNYIFGGFKTLDLPGIKHQWRVGIVTEITPEGYVGVSPVCILGLNENEGEEISLHLQTDDLKVFRKYQSIKKTLLHELVSLKLLIPYLLGRMEITTSTIWLTL